MTCTSCKGEGVVFAGYQTFDTGDAVLSSFNPEFEICVPCGGTGLAMSLEATP